MQREREAVFPGMEAQTGDEKGLAMAKNILAWSNVERSSTVRSARG